MRRYIISYWKEIKEQLILKLHLSTVFVWNQFTSTTFYQNSNYYARHKFQEILQIIMLLKGRKSYNVLMEVVKMSSPKLMLSYKAFHGHYIAYWSFTCGRG
jgi:hypothetical protein